MANYTVRHNCGHDEAINLVGKHADRERKIGWMEKQDCRACWQAAQAKTAQVHAGQVGLPDLTGSERQVAWALTLRGSWYNTVQDRNGDRYLRSIGQSFLGNLAAHKLTQELVKQVCPTPAAYKGMHDATVADLLKETAAKFWIENMRSGNTYDCYDADVTFINRLAARIRAAAQAARKTVKTKLADIMRRAWAIARDAAKKLGCALKQIVFGECLRLAWAEAR